MKKLKKGFTLIELLVVIAIIGILATIVIINIASARGKAVNAHVLADLNTADKNAVICMDQGDKLTTDSYHSGLQWGNCDGHGGSCAGGLVSSSDLICSTGTDHWPAINTYGNSTDGSPMELRNKFLWRRL